MQDQSTDARVPGQTITTLPDGRLLKTGGLEQQGPVSTVTIEDAHTTTQSVESIRIQRSRAFHTATMLPDGMVLIVGGIGGAAAEWIGGWRAVVAGRGLRDKQPSQ